MKKKLLTCMVCAFAFCCTPLSVCFGTTVKAFAVDSAFSPIYLETTGTKEVTSATNLSAFRIKDESGVAVAKGTVYALTIDNGFIFQNTPEIFLSGKYREKVSFEIDSQDPSTAYITIDKKTSDSHGFIEIQNLDIAPTKKSQTNTDIILTLSSTTTYDTIKVGTYKESSSYKTAITIQSFQGGEKPSASGMAAAGKKLQVRIDGEEYGTITVEDDGTWNYVFPYKYSNLEEGSHTFAIGYYQNEKTWFGTVSKEFEILPPQTKTTATVCFTVGNNTYTYDGRTGYLEASPFIDGSGRTLLPLRAVANTLGVDTKEIQWDEKTHTITIVYNQKTISCTIGSSVLTVNGVISEMDTAPIISNGVTFLPLRPLLNAFGITDVNWDDTTATVSYEAEKPALENI